MEGESTNTSVCTQVQSSGVHVLEVYKGGEIHKPFKNHFRLHTSPRLMCTNKSSADVCKYKVDVYLGGRGVTLQVCPCTHKSKAEAHTQVQG